MRILQIRFCNLNSLVGEWRVDLTNPAYVADGIFAITGPTGAGKTTLLDAVCLALYGRTPRLSKVTQGANDIMSRQTGECFAEVVFETTAGRYRSHWSQHRARKKAGAALQAPKHEIALADSGEILESSLRGSVERIEALTGMDFERFTRSMLLAQGGFAAFLQAGADERAPILEQITGTEIYSQISIRVHETLRSARDALALLKAETQGVTLLDEAEEAGLQQAVVRDLAAEAQVKADQTQLQAQMAWLKGIETLENELIQLLQEEARLALEEVGFVPERQRLVRAQSASVLDGQYAALCGLRSQQVDDAARQAKVQALVPGLQASVDALNQQMGVATQRTQEARQALKTQAPLLQEVRLLDQQLASIVREQVQVQKNDEVRQYQASLAEAQKALQLVQTQALDARAEQQNAVQQLTQAQATLADKLQGRMLREYRAEKESLLRELALLARIAELESHRARLEEGQPCPLCGATDHPFVKGQVPVPDAVELRISALTALIETLEGLEGQVIALQAALQKVAERQAALHSAQAVAQSRLEAAQLACEQAQARQTAMLSQLQQHHLQVSMQRQALFGDQQADVEERRLQVACDQAELAERVAREQLAQQTEKLTQAQAQIQTLKERLDETAKALVLAQPAFDEARREAGFADEAAFLAARLDAKAQQALMQQAKALDDRRINLEARTKDRRQRLDAATALQLTQADHATLEARSRQAELELNRLAQAIAGVRHRLADNAAARLRLQEKQHAIEAQQVECQRWENLHALIGSSDGKKYRNFAQGLTFEMMVRHANRQLQKMTDRYLLVRDTVQPLELNVVDTYQAGEVRSTRNLSGGESFIVSLSLALGLSNMASQNVRVDSLFLDEGFGTLDEDALDTALETLAGLHQEGKLIGVISHVPALKDRISTQIEVIPMTGGKSVLNGPGCFSV